MRAVFADTYYYLALASRRDAGHERAIAISREYRGDVLTTPWVLTEVATRWPLQISGAYSWPCWRT